MPFPGRLLSASSLTNKSISLSGKRRIPEGEISNIMKNNYVHHLCIQTNSYLETIRFYTKALGFEIVQESPNFHGREFNTWLKLGSFYIELQTGKQNEILAQVNSNSEGVVHFCIWVENLELEVEQLQKVNVTFIKKNDEIIYQVENGYLCKLIAPEGTIIELRNNQGI